MRPFFNHPFTGLVYALCTLICPGQNLAAGSEDPARAFAQANVLFETGKHAEAAAAYEAIARSSKVSSSLYFNLGTAHLKAGQLGRAIFYLRQARRLAPRDDDIRANLRFAREKAAGGLPLKAQPGRDLANWLSLDEWAVLAASAAWLWLGLLTLNQLRPAWRQQTRPWLAPLCAVALLLLSLAGNACFHQARHEAVVIARESTVRYGPLEESQTAYTLTDGVEVRVLDDHNGWLHVSDANGREGWLQAGQVARLDTSR